MNRRIDDDDMRSEYDFGRSERGKRYAGPDAVCSAFRCIWTSTCKHS
jgi:hypothetical protein